MPGTIMNRADRLVDTPASVDVNANVTGDVEPAVAATAHLVLMGFSARETAGTPAVATFRIMHGASVSGGTELVSVELNGNESAREWFGPGGIDASSGITLDHIAGAFDCSIFYKAVI